MLRRLLWCRTSERHCQNPGEDNTTIDWGWYDDGEALNDDDNPGGDLPPCTTNSEGSFGSTSSADYVETVVFQYQVQTTLSVTPDALVSNQLPLIERTLSNLLVPDLFQGSACQASRGRRRLLVQPAVAPSSSRRTLLEVPIGASDLTGLESSPTDTIAPGLDGVRCRTSLVDGADRCYVINGGFTLHGSSDIRWAQPVALELVKMHLDQGHLSTIDPGNVVAVQYLTEGAPSLYDDDTAFGNNPSFTPPPTSGGGSGNADGGESAREPPQPSSSGASTSTEAWPWVILGGGLLLAGLAMWILGRRRRRQRALDEGSLDSEEKPLDRYDTSAYRPPEDAYLQDDVPTSANSSSFVSAGSTPAASPQKSGRNWSPSKWSTSTPPSYYEDDDDVEEDLYERSRRQRHFV